MYKYIIMATVCLIPLQVIAAEHPTIAELLDKFAESQSKLKSFTLKSETTLHADSKSSFLPGFEKGTKGTQHYYSELRSDGNRHFYLEKLSGDLPDGTKLDKNLPGYNSFLWDGENRYQYLRSHTEKSEDDLVYLTRKGQKKANGNWILESGKGQPLRGIFEGSWERVDSDLKRAHTILVQDKMEQVGDSKCYVISAETKESKYKIWIDPDHGYNIAKAMINRRGYERQHVKPEPISQFIYLNNVRFQKIYDTWIPVEADYGYNKELVKGNYSKADYHHKITEFILNPDHETLGSFKTDYIRNGARLHIIGVKGIHYTWQNGQVVDEKGRVIMDCRPKKPAENIDKK